MMSRIRRFRSAPILASMFAALWLAGCAAQETADTANTEQEPAAEEAAPAPAEEPAPEVNFANIEDGGTYASPVELIFEAVNYDIVPVEEPPVVREGEGHFHLAVDVECVTAGEIIPPGTPSYIHFGDGTDRIELQLEPGEHTLCLQMADGEHRVLDGPEMSNLTEQITITIEEGDGGS